MDNFARSVFVITKPPTSKDEIVKRSKKIIEFADNNEIVVNIGYSGEKLLCDVEATGLTTAYCRGCVAEVKEMLKLYFGCKIDTSLSAY